MATITALDVADVRFPTSQQLDGSDAMNPDPDYSAACATLRVDDGSAGYGFVFTIGRGNDVVTAALAALRPYVVGRDADELTADLGLLSRTLIGDSQLRWLGPEKGVIHMAIGAVVNAVWDLAARRAGQPLWRFLAGLTPAQLVDLVDFRYLTDAITPDEALDLLTARRHGAEERTADLLAGGYPAYTTSPGWLGYDDDKVARLCALAVDDGFRQIKLKVGLSQVDDVRRLKIARSVVGADIAIATDANQRWDVDTAIEWVRTLAPFDLAWIEEPTSPDDIGGHRRIRQQTGVPVATGEHVQNRVIFKQLLQSEAIDVLQIDACRVGGVNENLAILLLAAKFGVPVCPHAGGVGLCELVQHLAMFDYVAVSGSLDGRTCEWVDHLHEHFDAPAIVRRGRYVAPTVPGFSAQLLDESIENYRFPDGPVWKDADG